MSSRLFFFASFLWLFGLNSICSFQHFSSVLQSILQWSQWFLGSLHWFLVVFVFLSFPPYHFFFPSFEASWFSFYLELLGLPFNWPVFSRYFSCTHASSIVLGLKSITCFHRWLCKPPIYLRSTSGFLGEMPIFMNSLVYSCTLCPCLYLK